jgi:hypothetical protein
MDVSVNFILPPEQPLSLNLNLDGDFEYGFGGIKPASDPIYCHPYFHTCVVATGNNIAM